MITQNYLQKRWEDLTDEDMLEMSRYLQATMDDEEIEPDPYDPEPTLWGQAYLEHSETLKKNPILVDPSRGPIFFPKGLLNL